jgi:hypothetical protein
MKNRFLALCLLLAMPQAFAEVLAVGGVPSADAVQTPHRGATQASVAARYGEPRQRLAAVGQPPITRWVYDAFVVYFEGDHVIHAVVTSK